MNEYTLPELLRVPLADICVQAKSIARDMRIADFLNLAIQPPGPLNIEQSIQILQSIGALDQQENLTELGAHLGDIPIDVRYGKMVLFGVVLRCLDPILTIVSALSVASPFILPSFPPDRIQVHKVRMGFGENAYSDHLVLLRLYQKWTTERCTKGDRAFCAQNFIRPGTMETMASVRAQLLGHLRSLGFVSPHGVGNVHELNWNSQNWAVVKACLVAGHYPNVAHINRKKSTMTSSMVKTLGIHKSSVIRCAGEKKDSMKSFPSEWLIFEEKVRIASYLLAQTSTLVNALTIALFAGPSFMLEDEHLFVENTTNSSDDDGDDENENLSPDPNGITLFKIDEWLQFLATTNNAYLVFHLRQKFYAQFQKLLHNPRQYFQADRSNQVVKVIAGILEDEDRVIGLPELKDVGLPPRAIGINVVFPPKQQTSQTSRSDYNAQQYAPRRRLEYTNSNFQPPQQQTWRNENQPPASQQRHNPQGTNSKAGAQAYQQNHNVVPAAEKVPKSRNPPVGQSDDWRLPVAKFIVVRAVSKNQILQTIRGNNWNFSTSIRTSLNRFKRNRPWCKAFILFHVPEAASFCCFTEYRPENEKVEMKLLSEQQLSYLALQNIITNAGFSANTKQLHEYFDGEEIPNAVAKVLFQSLVNS